MSIIDLTAVRKDNELRKKVALTAELVCYKAILTDMAGYLEIKDISPDSVNKLLGMLSLAIAKLVISSEHCGVEVLVDKLMEGVKRDIDNEMERYLTSDDYKLYFEQE